MNELFAELEIATKSYTQLCDKVRRQLLLEKFDLEANKAQFEEITAKINNYHTKEPVTLNIGLNSIA